MKNRDAISGQLDFFSIDLEGEEFQTYLKFYIHAAGYRNGPSMLFETWLSFSNSAYQESPYLFEVKSATVLLSNNGMKSLLLHTLDLV